MVSIKIFNIFYFTRYYHQLSFIYYEMSFFHSYDNAWLSFLSYYDKVYIYPYIYLKKRFWNIFLTNAKPCFDKDASMETPGL